MSEKLFRAMSNEVKQWYCIESVEGEMFSIQEVVDLLNKATDDFKWQIRQSEKWSAKVKQLKKENRELRQELNGKDCRKCGNYCRDKALDYCLVDEREPYYFSFPFGWDYKAEAEKCKYYYR